MQKSLGTDIEFIPVDPAYYRVLLLTALCGTVAGIIPISLLTFFYGSTTFPGVIWWIILGIFLLGVIWVFYLVRRRARALGYAELEEVLVIRRGVMFQSITAIPYGRMQQVNINRGPFLRHYGLAEVELVTASAESNGSIPGLRAETAEALRMRLTALGNANRVEGL